MELALITIILLLAAILGVLIGMVHALRGLLQEMGSQGRSGTQQEETIQRDPWMRGVR